MTFKVGMARFERNTIFYGALTVTAIITRSLMADKVNSMETHVDVNTSTTDLS